MAFPLLTGASAHLRINVIWEEETAIQILTVLIVLHAATTTAETIFIEPEATGLALRIAVKGDHADDNTHITWIFFSTMYTVLI